MEELSDLAMWSLIVGFLLPPALAVVQQSSWHSAVKAVVAFGASLAAGVGIAYFTDTLTGRDWVSASLVVLVTTIATYQSFWKQTKIAPKIEAATDIPALNRGAGPPAP